MIVVNIAKDFTKTPGARYISEGPFSGELFRKQCLEKLFEDSSSEEKIKVILDGTAGYATSFLEESFGGLARLYGAERVLSRLLLVSEEDKALLEEVDSYIRDVK